MAGDEDQDMLSKEEREQREHDEREREKAEQEGGFQDVFLRPRIEADRAQHFLTSGLRNWEKLISPSPSQRVPGGRI